MPVSLNILDGLFDDIQDVYPNFDKDKYCSGPGLLKSNRISGFNDSDDDPTGDPTNWTFAAYKFLSHAVGAELGFRGRIFGCYVLRGHEYIGITSKGFLQSLSEYFSLENDITAYHAYGRILTKIHDAGNHELTMLNAPHGDDFRLAIETFGDLLKCMRLLDYARIADRHLEIRKLRYAAESESGVKDAVESTQNILDSVTAELNHKEKNELERLLYNAARRNGTLPSKFYIKNVRRLEEHPFGGGSYGDVYKGKIDALHVAVKVSRFFWNAEEKERIHRELCREALIWKPLKHRHVLPFLGLCAEGFPSTGLVSPFMHRGNLPAYLKRTTGVDKKQVMKQLCSGLQYLHCYNPAVVHGDLKCANVLVDEAGNPRIADFGLARLIGIATLTTNSGGHGTLRWQAPELIHPSKYGGNGRVNAKTDVYAFGMTCLEILTGEVPFYGISDWEVITIAQNGTGLKSALAIVQGSDYLVQILQYCCSTNPDSRMDIQDKRVFGELNRRVHWRIPLSE